MAPLIRPFRGLLPRSEHAGDVAAPPYDVLNSEEARVRATGRPLSFLHVSKPEIDLPAGTDPFAAEVYVRGAQNMAAMIDSGVLVRDAAPCYYAYRLRMGDHVQTGLVCAASVEAYDANRIRKHEYTRPQKEDDRVRQITALNAQTGPVMAAFRAQPAVRELLDEATGSEPLFAVDADNGVTHTVWRIDAPTLQDRLSAEFDAMNAMYIADGHHRSASASRVAAARRAANPEHRGDEGYNFFLCVAFAHDDMQILDYNRVLRDLSGRSPEELLQQAAASFAVAPSERPVKPERTGQFGLYVNGAWHRLEIHSELIPDDPVASLDVALLQDHFIGPLLGIADQRTDERIDFVGGIRGLGELERRVDSGEMALAFSFYPTSMAALMAVADAGQVMPPKSTWFEPKLADGLVSHVLD